MTSTQDDDLLASLARLEQDGAVSPRLPLRVWKAVGALVTQGAVELLITRTGLDVLLTHRHDLEWSGWHVPGGYVGCGESLDAACQRIARRELGVDVHLENVVGAWGWTDHPSVHTVSILCACAPQSPPKQGQFFAVPPPDIVLHHREFVVAFLRYLELKAADPLQPLLRRLL